MAIGISAHMLRYIHGIGIIITIITSHPTTVITGLDHIIMIGTGLIIDLMAVTVEFVQIIQVDINLVDISRELDKADIDLIMIT